MSKCIYCGKNEVTRPRVCHECRDESAQAQLALNYGFDVVVRMPPKRAYHIDLKVQSTRKAELRVVDPETLDTGELDD